MLQGMRKAIFISILISWSGKWDMIWQPFPRGVTSTPTARNHKLFKAAVVAASQRGCGGCRPSSTRMTTESVLPSLRARLALAVRWPQNVWSPECLGPARLVAGKAHRAADSTRVGSIATSRTRS